jgi:hypothetical protein
MRSISIRIRDFVSGLDALLLLLLDISLGELDKFLTLCVYLRVMLVTIFVANSTLDTWSSCIQEDTPSIFYLFILLLLNLLLWWLRINLWCGFPLLQLLHHIVMVILRILHFSLLLQLIHFKFKLLDFSLQVIIFLTYSLITRFHKHFLNIRTRGININVIASFTSIACRGLGALRSLDVLEELDQRASNCTSRS